MIINYFLSGVDNNTSCDYALFYLTAYFCFIIVFIFQKFSGEYLKNKEPGLYNCTCCGFNLFRFSKDESISSVWMHSILYTIEIIFSNTYIIVSFILHKYIINSLPHLHYSSIAKYDSGCGWPSFTRALTTDQTDSPEASSKGEGESLQRTDDNSYGYLRIEITCKNVGQTITY